MTEDLMKPVGTSAESAPSQLRRVLEEELNQYFAQLDAMVVELEGARKNESAKERQA